VSSEQLLKIMKEKTSHEREAFAYASIERRLLTHLWAKFDRVDQFEIEYKTDSTPKQITLDPVDYSYYNKLKESFNLEDKSEFSLSYPASQTALLTVDTFSKHKNQEFKQKIKSYFKEIQKKDVDNLIIDLRDNGGGSTSLVNYLYEFITPKPYLNFAQGEVKVSEYALRERSGNLSKLANLQEDRVEVKKPKLKKPSKNKYRFKGQVYVLIGPYTFSSATDFAALIKDFETGILVGQETGGLASSYGDKIRGQLSNSGLDFAVSYKKFVRPAGYDNGRGVIPDIKVENNYQEERNGIDQILNKALEQIEAK
jgi:C-terminal processing protease CtpA/Prc